MSNKKRKLVDAIESRSSELTMKSFQFTWQIANYSSRAQNCAPNTAITSPPFVLYDKKSSINFVLCFYPAKKAGSKNGTNDGEIWSGLYLDIESKDKYDGNYHIELAILDADGKIFRSENYHEKIPFNQYWGFGEFIRKSELENPSNNLLPDDKLTILCRIEKTNREDGELCDCPDEDGETPFPLLRLAEDYATLLEKETLSDVHFVVQNLKIPAHKVVLAARSPVFAAMFQNEMQENSSNEVVVTDMEPDALKQMLQFIYTGRCQIGAWTEDLFLAADKYDIKDLKGVCEDELGMKLCVDNALRFLILSDLHRAAELKEDSISFINKNAVEIMKKPAWKDLIKTHPHVIAELYSNMFDVEDEAK